MVSLPGIVENFFASDSKIHTLMFHMHHFFLLQNVTKPDLKIKLCMEVAVNGRKFEIKGEGKGKPFE